MFALIQFTNSTIAVVPVGWLKDDLCYWPNVKDVSKLVKANQIPNPDWTLHKVEVKFVCGTYEEIKQKERKYQYSSDLNTTDSDDLGKSKRGSKRQKVDESSDDEDCIPSSVCNDNHNVLQNFSVNAGKEGQSSRLEFPPIPENPVTECSFTLSTISSPPEEAYQIVPPAPPVSSDSSKKILKEVMHNRILLVQHGETLGTILTTLNNLYAKVPSEKTIKENIIMPVNLPLESMEDLKVLEEALNEESFRDYMCEKLSQIGGSSLGNAVRRMLSKLMCNKLAMSFSWVGMKEKEPFSTLRIASVLISAVRRSPAFSHSHDIDIETVIKDWLRHAKARCKE